VAARALFSSENSVSVDAHCFALDSGNHLYWRIENITRIIQPKNTLTSSREERRAEHRLSLHLRAERALMTIFYHWIEFLSIRMRSQRRSMSRHYLLLNPVSWIDFVDCLLVCLLD
jgi:hypothetical protein